jgi:uncharacterized protein YecE (DUF72 family)
MIRAGSSGFSYKPWKGPFYPEKLPDKEMLGYYAERLPTVEINNTFYRMPKTSVLEDWAAKTPKSFRFVLKASRRITHMKRLKECEEPLGFVLKGAEVLGDRLGALLFQLPPNLKHDQARLDAFLALLPGDVRAAFEFRHESWFNDTVYEALQNRNAALCLSEFEDGDKTTPPETTADWGYLRLRRNAYGDKELAKWRAFIESQPWKDTFVFFKHEDEGAAPKMALRLMEQGA